MQFDNVVDYIWQVYSVGIPVQFAQENVRPLTYLKLVRLTCGLSIDTTDCTAEQLFAQAVQMERNNRPGWDMMFQLADLHEECEVLIRKSGVLNNTGTKAYVDDINS